MCWNKHDREGKNAAITWLWMMMMPVFFKLKSLSRAMLPRNHRYVHLCTWIRGATKKKSGHPAMFVATKTRFLSRNMFSFFRFFWPRLLIEMFNFTGKLETTHARCDHLTCSLNPVCGHLFPQETTDMFTFVQQQKHDIFDRKSRSPAVFEPETCFLHLAQVVFLLQPNQIINASVVATQNRKLIIKNIRMVDRHFQHSFWWLGCCYFKNLYQWITKAMSPSIPHIKSHFWYPQIYTAGLCKLRRKNATCPIMEAYFS